MPFRESVEKRAPLPDLRDVFLCHAWDDWGGVAKKLYELLKSVGEGGDLRAIAQVANRVGRDAHRADRCGAEDEGGGSSAQGSRHAMPSRGRRGAGRVIDAASIAEDRKGWLFRTSHAQRAHADRATDGAGRRLAHDAPARSCRGHQGADGNHSFRATGITTYLANGGALEHAQSMRIAVLRSPRFGAASSCVCRCLLRSGEMKGCGACAA